MSANYYRISLILLGFLIVLPCQAQWKRVTNIEAGYTSNYWLDVYFLESNPNYGWICGYNGKVLRTTDAGQSWHGTTISTGGQLESIQFRTPLIGYTSGDGKIFKSYDGGASWTDITDYRAIYLWGTYFFDKDNGMVIGGGCTEAQQFFRTSDGGNTWNLFEAYIPDTGLTDCILYPGGMGYASSSGRIWITTDSGYSWKILCVSGSNDWQES
jgi:photosystem II stability/assembly factor-like uncharacterized protein